MSGSRAFAGAFETEGLEGCCGDSGANRRFVELAPQHARRRAREPDTHHSPPGIAYPSFRALLKMFNLKLQGTLANYQQIDSWSGPVINPLITGPALMSRSPAPPAPPLLREFDRSPTSSYLKVQSGEPRLTSFP